jgi:hypothetical protein
MRAGRRRFAAVVNRAGVRRVRGSALATTAARVVGAVALVHVTLGLAADPAGAGPRPAVAASGATGPRWSLTHARNPRYPDGTLNANSCTGPTACIAVGSANTAGFTESLAESWNGTRWSIIITANPPGFTTSELDGVSCSASGTCTAVGQYRGAFGDDVMLVEAWNGVAWSIQTPPNPANATRSSLVGVSCTSATACTAVGSYDLFGASRTLTEAWDGTAWSIQPTPNPSANTGSVLTAVSCASATACTAVGFTGGGTSPNSVPLAESWDGTAWSIQAVPNPSGATHTYLHGVSCSSASACTAVGSTDSSGNTATLVESWNGAAWSIGSSPNPVGASFSFFDGVSCRSAAACTAVGAYHLSTFADFMLVESWNGAAWTIESMPSPPGSDDSVLNGVSCPLATACTATGLYSKKATGPLTLAESWNGAAWTSQTTPNPTGAFYESLDGGVSCSSATTCTAVGTLAEAWDGTTWRTQTTKVPAGGSGPSLLGVSCSAANACAAVGVYRNNAGSYVMLVEAWNGSTWSIQTTQNPTGAGWSDLNSVSCLSAMACTAVGAYQTSSGTWVTLAERWNGSTWTVQDTPNPAGATSSFLSGVSCRSANACTAAGFTQDSSGNTVTFAESWHGTAWRIRTTPSPPGATDVLLNGVSCSSATACAAVGSYRDSTGTRFALAESWNGTAWSIETTPNTTGGSESGLSGVSCTSATACSAVGSYVNSTGTQVTLAEVWNGTSWTIQKTPNPTGGTGSRLLGVSCTAATTCVAAGSYLNSSRTSETLAEAERP